MVTQLEGYLLHMKKYMVKGKFDRKSYLTVPHNVNPNIQSNVIRAPKNA